MWTEADDKEIEWKAIPFTAKTTIAEEYKVASHDKKFDPIRDDSFGEYPPWDEKG